VDKVSGYLQVTAARSSGLAPPALYGFVPQTYSGGGYAGYPKGDTGDGDPLDMCVLSEREVTRAEIIVHARVVGGLRWWMVRNQTTRSSGCWRTI